MSVIPRRPRRRNLSRAFIVAPLLCALVAGCTEALLSEISVEGPSKGGLVYHLPRTMLKVTVVQKVRLAGPHEIKKPHFFMWAKFENSNGRASDADLKAYKGDVRDDAKIKDRIDRLFLEEAENTKDNKYYANFINDDPVGFTITVTAETGPDPVQRYELSYQPSGFSDDRLCVGRTPSGLLRTVQFAADDRTPQIAFNVFRAAATVFARPTGVSQEREAVAVGDPRKTVDRSVEWFIDPLLFYESDSGRKRFNFELDSFEARMAEEFGSETSRKYVGVDFSALFSTLEQAMKKVIGDKCPEESGKFDRCIEEEMRKLATKNCAKSEVCYRTTIEAPIYLTQKPDPKDAHATEPVEDGWILASDTVEVINPFDNRGVAVERAFLVEKVTKLVFDDGVLTGVAIRKPSTFEEASLLPVNAITALLSAPVGLAGELIHGASTEELNLINSVHTRQDAALKQFRDAQAQAEETARIVHGSTKEKPDEAFRVQCSTETGSLLAVSGR